MQLKQENQIPIRRYRLGELAILYSVDKKTFRKWLKPFLNRIGPRQGQFYNLAQVRIIFESLEPPTGSFIEN
jgi:hypothetical protein